MVQQFVIDDVDLFFINIILEVFQVDLFRRAVRTAFPMEKVDLYGLICGADDTDSGTKG